MMNEEITIRMPKESLRLWLEALRSGKYEQGKGKLKTEKGAYCCLGVLQHCLTGEVESSTLLQGALSVPSLPWLKDHGIKFYNGFVDETYAPYLPTLGMAAFTANDNGGYNFKQIADAIEACAEGV